MAEIELTGPRTYRVMSNQRGIYEIDGLERGTYRLKGVFAAQPIVVSNIDIHDGEATYVDLTFTLGDPQPIRVEFSDHTGEITRYHPKDLSPTTARIEGTISELQTRQRVAGAVVTAIPRVVAVHQEVEQTITDDAGRFRFLAVVPGTYTVSASYSVGGRAQIEVQRNQIEVAGAEAVDVPLAFEMTR